MACKETSETQGGECTLCAKRASAIATHLLRGAPGFFCTAGLEGDRGAAARPFPPISAGYWPAAAPVYQRVHERSCIDCRNAKTVPRKKKTADFTITQPTAALDRQGRPQRHPGARLRAGLRCTRATADLGGQGWPQRHPRARHREKLRCTQPTAALGGQGWPQRGPRGGRRRCVVCVYACNCLGGVRAGSPPPLGSACVDGRGGAVRRVRICLFMWAGCERRAWSPLLGCGRWRRGRSACGEARPPSGDGAVSGLWGAGCGERCMRGRGVRRRGVRGIDTHGYRAGGADVKDTLPALAHMGWVGGSAWEDAEGHTLQVNN